MPFWNLIVLAAIVVTAMIGLGIVAEMVRRNNKLG